MQNTCHLTTLQVNAVVLLFSKNAQIDFIDQAKKIVKINLKKYFFLI